MRRLFGDLALGAHRTVVKITLDLWTASGPSPGPEAASLVGPIFFPQDLGRTARCGAVLRLPTIRAAAYAPGRLPKPHARLRHPHRLRWNLHLVVRQAPTRPECRSTGTRAIHGRSQLRRYRGDGLRRPAPPDPSALRRASALLVRRPADDARRRRVAPHGLSAGAAPVALCRADRLRGPAPRTVGRARPAHRLAVVVPRPQRWRARLGRLLPHFPHR